MLKWKCKCTACADYNELKKYNCKSKDMLILCLKLQLDKANAQLQKGNIPNVSGQWVSVSEKLPPLDMPIYVYHSIGEYIRESHRRTESYFQSKAMQDITYWQEKKIPEKPIDA